MKHSHSPMKRPKQRRPNSHDGTRTTNTNEGGDAPMSASAHLRARARSSSPPPTPPPLGGIASPKGDFRPRIPPRSSSADDVAIPPSPSLRRSDHKVLMKQQLPAPAVFRPQASLPSRPPRGTVAQHVGTVPSARQHRNRFLGKHYKRPKELWQWTVWSASFLFRATSILGLILFFLQYAFLAAGMNVEVRLIAHMDWNMLGLEEGNGASAVSGDPDLPPLSQLTQATKQEQQPLPLQQQPIATEQNISAIENNQHQAAAAAAQPIPLEPLNVTLPPWVICPDGRNVSSCHYCAATNPAHLLGIAGCTSNNNDNHNDSPCQWCPHGAAWDTSMPQTENPDQGVVVYDDNGQAFKLFHTHVPLGAQCVSTRQTCRSVSTDNVPLWQQDVKLLETKPFLAEMARKAAPHIVPKQCQSRGFRYCPYGALHTYHEAMQEAVKSDNVNSNNATFSALPYRPPQCIPRRLHCQPPDELLVQPNDRLYRQRYGSAVVIPSHKLIFIPIPKVASTTWLQLFRRMMGLADWQTELGPLPHNPDLNGLIYLSDYSRAQATDMWTSPAWTKAIMIRDPKERLLSAYLDKVVRSPTRSLVHGACCPDTKDCAKDPDMTLEQFVDMLLERDCWNTGDHWNVQYERMERKYWSHVTMILQSSRAANDARNLLEAVGAWSDFGATGWGPDGKGSIFGPRVTTRHVTNATTQLAKYYNSAELEAKVEKMLYKDYRQKQFGFVRGSILSSTETNEKVDDGADRVSKTDKVTKTKRKKVKG